MKIPHVCTVASGTLKPVVTVSYVKATVVSGPIHSAPGNLSMMYILCVRIVNSKQVVEV